MSWRARTADLLDHEGPATFASRAVHGALLLVIGVSVVVAAIETIEGWPEGVRRSFRRVELVALAVLLLEYLVRLWIAPERHPAGEQQPGEARRAYALSAHGVIDLLALVPALAFVVPVDDDWLRVVRLLRLLKLARYTPALSLFIAVVRNEARALLATLLVVAVLLVLESAVMFVLEREAQPKVFASIPHAMWWAIVTIATVGYGDMFPVTAAGKVFGGMVMVIGIALFAVPAGILATGFASEVRKRDFVVTWHTVARVPFFAGLEATRIAEIARLLKRQIVPAHFAVVRRGEPADAMFFIMSGQVEVDIQPRPVRLGPGQYFGEIALVRDTVRMATVTAFSECQLLSLEAADFRQVLEAHPHLREAVTRVAEERIAAATHPGASPPEPPTR